MNTPLRGLLLLIIVFVSGCATRVYPPRSPDQPATVYFMDYGVHSSLLLPEDQPGKYVEYVFGDYAFTAGGKGDLFHIIRALCFSNRSSFGKREHVLPPGQKLPDPQPPAHRIVPIQLDRGKIETLRRQLETRWRAGDGPPVLLEWNHVTYVGDWPHYSIFSSCNHETKRWLKEMGCEVDGFPIGSNFIVMEPR